MQQRDPTHDEIKGIAGLVAVLALAGVVIAVCIEAPCPSFDDAEDETLESGSVRARSVAPPDPMVSPRPSHRATRELPSADVRASVPSLSETPRALRRAREGSVVLERGEGGWVLRF